LAERASPSDLIESYFILTLMKKLCKCRTEYIQAQKLGRGRHIRQTECIFFKIEKSNETATAIKERRIKAMTAATAELKQIPWTPRHIWLSEIIQVR